MDQVAECTRAQGQLYCEIDQRPAPAQKPDLRRISTYAIRSGGLEIVMANVACRLYAPADRRALVRGRLTAAFDTLRSGLT